MVDDPGAGTAFTMQRKGLKPTKEALASSPHFANWGLSNEANRWKANPKTHGVFFLLFFLPTSLTVHMLASPSTAERIMLSAVVETFIGISAMIIALLIIPVESRSCGSATLAQCCYRIRSLIRHSEKRHRKDPRVGSAS